MLCPLSARSAKPPPALRLPWLLTPCFLADGVTPVVGQPQGVPIPPPEFGPPPYEPPSQPGFVPPHMPTDGSGPYVPPGEYCWGLCEAGGGDGRGPPWSTSAGAPGSRGDNRVGAAFGAAQGGSGLEQGAQSRSPGLLQMKLFTSAHFSFPAGYYPPPGPHPPMGYYPAPGHYPSPSGHTATVLVPSGTATTVTVLQGEIFQAAPVQTVCPHCQQAITTKITYEIGLMSFLLGFFCCFVG